MVSGYDRRLPGFQRYTVLGSDSNGEFSLQVQTNHYFLNPLKNINILVTKMEAGDHSCSDDIGSRGDINTSTIDTPACRPQKSIKRNLFN
jgi:hypothetical protein